MRLFGHLHVLLILPIPVVKIYYRASHPPLPLWVSFFVSDLVFYKVNFILRVNLFVYWCICISLHIPVAHCCGNDGSRRICCVELLPDKSIGKENWKLEVIVGDEMFVSITAFVCVTKNLILNKKQW